MDCPDLLEALRRGRARNFQPGREEHLRQQEKSPARRRGGDRRERRAGGATAARESGRNKDPRKVHFRRTSATCLSVLRCLWRGSSAPDGGRGAATAESRERSCAGGEKNPELPAAASPLTAAAPVNDGAAGGDGAGSERGETRCSTPSLRGCSGIYTRSTAGLRRCVRARVC